MTIPDTLLTDVQQAVDIHQPELAVSSTDTFIVLEGLFVVSGPEGPFDAYQVKVLITAGFPTENPVVFEQGGRIPRTVNRHVFPEEGSCCLGVWEEWLLTAPDHRFETFLTGPMQDYFISQTYFEANGMWPFGERSHGMLGVVEAYSDLLEVPQDAKIIVAYLNLLSLSQIKGHQLCPCGSGRRLRHCHRDELQRLSSKVSPLMAKRMLGSISPKKPAKQLR
ncbi:SEC-C domain-containing protein [Hoeflea sp. AS16]|uniref:SEC-C domain-containing protein n=1 Tax=Hoeflea sp. AS16 TaxID=3135779 RepID=UPI003174E6D2